MHAYDPPKWTTPVLLLLVPVLANPILVGFIMKPDGAPKAFTAACATFGLGLASFYAVVCMEGGQCSTIAWLYTVLALSLMGIMIYALARGYGPDFFSDWFSSISAYLAQPKSNNPTSTS
jgi:TM2 domain-containing membrane protein YozV